MIPDDFVEAVSALAQENGFGVTKLHFVSSDPDGARAEHEYDDLDANHASPGPAAHHVLGTFRLRVDSSELDEALRKAERLADTLDRVQASLSSPTRPVS
ncbi:MAG: hypothetical protein ACU0B9_07005 [Limimaricola soesokkakensis]|uniref:hypothetical protein n=1 Tax=Limimaricola soesokkakensis TaxID=1343159 RepID=UPI004058B1AC